MKWLATGLLVLAGAVYALAQAFGPAYPWLYYVSVSAEASMVGAIADWFAVTALFHHPLGLRFIPHTAIIPRNKQRVASGLSQFIQANFLTSAAVLQRIRDFQPARTLYGWLLRPENAEAVATYVTRLSAYLLGAMDDERVRHYLQQAIASRLKSDEALRERVQRLRDEALASPALAAYLGGVWDELRAWLAAEHDRRPASLHQRLTGMLESLGRTLRADRDMQAWLDEQILAGAALIVEEHRAKIGRFIEDQIMSWQEQKLVEELERHIGPDLQYIRINGTLVGAVAGLVIAALTHLVR